MLGDDAKSQTKVRRFLTEAQSMAGLDHDNIVDVYDYGRSADGPFLVMQYIDGGSLLDRCRKGTLPVEEAVDLICQICDALTMCHDADVIHRDIKPANILMTRDGSPRLTDFGSGERRLNRSQSNRPERGTGHTGLHAPGAAAVALLRLMLAAICGVLQPRCTRWYLESHRVLSIWMMFHNSYVRSFQKDSNGSRDARFQTAAEFRDALRTCLKSVAEPVPEVVVDLSAGECPKCHTRNESSRKFCSECAAALRVSCLKCESEIPVWDKVCGDCGGKQSELAASKLEEFASQREQAEEHRREYRFEAAISITRSLASEEDERIAEHVPWAEEFITSTESHWERERESASAHFDEARTHRAAFDYPSAIHAVLSVPESMRTSEISGYLQQLERDRAESEELIKTISERVKRREMKGLLGQVERAVELRGDRTDMHKLAGQLREREDKRRQQRDAACNEATRLFGTGDAKGALTMIQSVPSDDLRSSDEPLRRQLEEIVAGEDKLTALVKESKADGVLDPDEVVSMWQATVSYLKLNPRHEKIAGLQQQLEARIQKAPGKYASFSELAVFWSTRPVNVLKSVTAERVEPVAQERIDSVAAA